MGNLLDIYARASRRLPLTPAERALLRTFDQLLLSALAGAGVAIVQAAMSGQQPLTFTGLAQIGAYAAATALLAGITKLFRARGDALGAAIAQGLDQVGAKMPAPRGYPNGYHGPASGPISGPMAARLSTATGSFPPVMPDSPQRRGELLRQAGATLAGDSQPYGAVTKPVATTPTTPTAAVPPQQSSATAAQSAQTPNDAPTSPAPTPAPSQSEGAGQRPVSATQDAAASTGGADENGPPTQQMAAVRVSASAAPASTGLDIAPPPPVPPSQWLQ